MTKLLLATMIWLSGCGIPPDGHIGSVAVYNQTDQILWPCLFESTLELEELTGCYPDFDLVVVPEWSDACQRGGNDCTGSYDATVNQVRIQYAPELRRTAWSHETLQHWTPDCMGLGPNPQHVEHWRRYEHQNKDRILEGCE